uniref:DDX60-like winged helix domain-containing protein n=1 Tax=Leptobrachium leishanense TaxID=445787 RepID=A0A8C5PRN4_9ANUR
MAFEKVCETQILKLHCVFSLHYLICEGYLDQDCNLLAFTDLATMLHNNEPSNFVFVSFFHKGLFRMLCQPFLEGSEEAQYEAMESLVLVLAHLFERSYFIQHPLRLHQSQPSSEVDNVVLPRMPVSGLIRWRNQTYLGKLPHESYFALREHNHKVANIFGHFLLTLAKLAHWEKEYSLPLSQIHFAGKECSDSNLLNHLLDCTVERNAISPFACLSGNTDHNLITLENVSSLMLQTARIPDRNIPILHLEKTDGSGRKMFLNSYVVDFFRHGYLKEIVKNNGLFESNAFYKLQDFTRTIGTISNHLKEMSKEENDPVVLAFEKLKKEFENKMDYVINNKV